MEEQERSVERRLFYVSVLFWDHSFSLFAPREKYTSVLFPFNGSKRGNMFLWNGICKARGYLVSTEAEDRLSRWHMKNVNLELSVSETKSQRIKTKGQINPMQIIFWFEKGHEAKFSTYFITKFCLYCIISLRGEHAENLPI